MSGKISNYFLTISDSDHWLSNPPNDSQLTREGISLMHISTRSGLDATVGIDILTLKIHVSGDQEKHTKHLGAVLNDLMPLILDYRSSLLELDNAKKSSADIRACSEVLYRAKYLSYRIHTAYGQIRDQTSQKERQSLVNELRDLNPERITQEVRDRPSFLRYVAHFHPQEVTPELCDLAVHNDGKALRHVPGIMRSYDLCLKAFNRQGGRALEYVPEVHKTQELVTRALTIDGSNLEFVEPSKRDAGKCLLAILQDSLAYSFIPKEQRSTAIEYAHALHGMGNPGEIYELSEKADPTLGVARQLDGIYDQFIAMHYEGASNDDLEDIGHHRREAA